jgi:non-specific serine/threonine protein kinase
MQYVEGQTLADRIRHQTLELPEAIEIALQVAGALSEAHFNKIIHRDIKPQNIMITPRGQVKVVDFGLAKFLEINRARQIIADAERLTGSDVVMGTLSYMSPEQLRNEPLDERTDIFSFGIVFHEMLTGALPFPGESPLEVASFILKGNPFQIDSLPAYFPAEVKWLIARMLERQRERRPGSFTEIKTGLEAIKERISKGWSAQTTLSLPAREPLHAGAWVASRAEAFLESASPTILVLPLEAVDSQEETSFLGIGLAHALTTDLAKLKGVSVLSKVVGAGRIDRAGSGARKVAEEMGATILLEGEVMRAGQTITIMARLTDARSGRVIWGAQYRGDASNLFDIQDAVCEGVAAALKVTISSEARGRLLRSPTINLDSFSFYSKGRALLERRDVEENIDSAISMFEGALKLDPDFALAQAGLSEAYWLKYETSREIGWVERAITAGDRALVLDPYQAQVHISMGIIYHGTANLERAIEEFEHAIELQPASDDAYRWLGRCYMRKGDMERAVNYFNKAIEIRPRYWDNYSRLGVCYYTFGHYNEAAEQFRRVISIQPDNYDGYNNLGAIYYLLGHYDDALTMYRRATEINPNPTSYSNLGTVFFYLKRYDDAVASYKAAVQLNSSDGLLYRNLGESFMRLGLREEAESHFRAACELLQAQLKVDPDDVQVLAGLAICQTKLGSKDEALANIERAIRLEPRNATLIYDASVVYALLGRTNVALEYLSRALAQGYSRAEAECDPDLDSLRGTPEYQALAAVEGHKSRPV